MDLRSYYKKIRDTEALLEGDHPIVVSLETPEGGKAGVRTQVSRPIAARLIAEARARVASEEEAREFLEMQAADRERIEAELEARRMQFVVVPQEARKPKERK